MRSVAAWNRKHRHRYATSRCDACRFIHEPVCGRGARGSVASEIDDRLHPAVVSFGSSRLDVRHVLCPLDRSVVGCSTWSRTTSIEVVPASRRECKPARPASSLAGRYGSATSSGGPHPATNGTQRPSPHPWSGCQVGGWLGGPLGCVGVCVQAVEQAPGLTELADVVRPVEREIADVHNEAGPLGVDMRDHGVRVGVGFGGCGATDACPKRLPAPSGSTGRRCARAR
jgi:hypothetical protein